MYSVLSSCLFSFYLCVFVVVIAICPQFNVLVPVCLNSDKYLMANFKWLHFHPYFCRMICLSLSLLLLIFESAIILLPHYGEQPVAEKQFMCAIINNSTFIQLHKNKYEQNERIHRTDKWAVKETTKERTKVNGKKDERKGLSISIKSHECT